MKKDKIYLILQGRIGNQLFQYAFARYIQVITGNRYGIVIDDSDVLRCNWINSLVYYDLPNVEYAHNSVLKEECKLSRIFLLRKALRCVIGKADYTSKFLIENRFQSFLNKNGLFICENGYIEPKLSKITPYFLEGFFQSESYFAPIADDIRRLFSYKQFSELKDYPNIEEIEHRNTVCISVKVEHNVGNTIYSVCDMNYWKRAIDYIVEKVEEPLFFICSDNVEYVLENLIDMNKQDYIIQSKDFPVHISLAVMSLCKHFVIGNTTFGWWAQYLSEYKGKITVAPSRWMAVDMPIDIYQPGWHLIEV